VDVDVDVDVDVVVVVVVNADADADDERRTRAPMNHATPSDFDRPQVMFGFQRLDVYQSAVKFLALCPALCDRAPRGHAGLADQLRRASLSIPLNIAEGSGKRGRDAQRFYTIARGSALECAAILDALEALGGVSEEIGVARALLERIVAMLTKLRET
jgi:four helix bundle protein